MEYERKFVITKIPDIKRLRVVSSKQVYLLIKPDAEVRVRQIKDQEGNKSCFLTVKKGEGLAREEYEFRINCNFFKNHDLRDFPRLNKVRTFFAPLPWTKEIVVDIFTTGDALLEVEFETPLYAIEFENSGFWKSYLSKQVEVTRDKRFYSKNLAQLNSEDLRNLFEEVRKRR